MEEKITLELTKEEVKMLKAACSIAQQHYNEKANEVCPSPLAELDEEDCELLDKFVAKYKAYYRLNGVIEKQMKQVR